MHGANAAPSSEHSNVTTGSFAENVNVAEVLTVVASGPESIVVSGGTPGAGALIVHVWRGRGLVDVAGEVDGAHLERVRAEAQRRVHLRAGAGDEVTGVDAVEPALERRPGWRCRSP